MAKIKLGDSIVAISGKSGGRVYSKNRGGSYMKNWVKPTNGRTTAQTLVRTIFTALSQAWAGIGAANQNGWIQASTTFQIKNVFGDLKTLAGNALYIALNKNLADVNIASIDTAPTKVVSTILDTPATVASTGAQTLVATFAGAIAADIAVKVFASPSLSAGVSTAGAKMRQIDVLDPAQIAAYSATTAYLAKFGTIGPAGNKIFLMFVPVAIANGQLSNTVRQTVIIGA
ncbi:MAG: hypothetical protein V4549_03270 [Bacteroidota bacterium]